MASASAAASTRSIRRRLTFLIPAFTFSAATRNVSCDATATLCKDAFVKQRFTNSLFPMKNRAVDNFLCLLLIYCIFVDVYIKHGNWTNTWYRVRRKSLLVKIRSHPTHLRYQDSAVNSHTNIYRFYSKTKYQFL